MITVVMHFRLYAPWVHSLKEKRSEVQSLCTRLGSTFNLSVIESGAQDTHQIIEISAACLAFDAAQADSIAARVQQFIESHTDAELTGTETERY